MTHPSPESLALHALGTGDPETERHVGQCRDCQAVAAGLDEAAVRLRRLSWYDSPSDPAGCPDESLLAELAAGSLSPEEREPRVTHLLDCVRCRTVLRGVAALLAEPAVQHEAAILAEAAASRRRRWLRPAGLAAAAALLVFVWARSVPQPGLREPALTSTVAPLPVAPSATVTRVDTLIWLSVPKAHRYRLRIYDGDGTVVWEAETRDTAVSLPERVTLLPGVWYFWRVESEGEWRRWAASDLVEFRVEPR